ncbi:MAG: hypothetical protein O8C67_06140, partial [Candidatus Methanoperedens sp.]|nr:hypothetical protein [Candidatus Methanoperedens sp.]
MQGKYDAEVPRYAYRVQYLENQVQDLTGQIEALKSTPATPPTSPATPATSIADVLKNSTDEKMKSFRDNFPDVFEGMTQIVNLMEGQIRQDTDRKLSALESHSVQDRQTKFAKAMNDKHLGWSTMGQDLNWAMWLSQKDRYSPKRRLDLLKDANASLDSEAVINLIDDFKAEMAKAGIAPATPPLTPAPVAPTVPFVAPPSGPSPAPPMNPPPQDAVTRSFINQFYQDKVRGKYKGRDEEIKKIQA